MRSAIAAVAACLMFGAAQAATAVWSTADVAATHNAAMALHRAGMTTEAVSLLSGRYEPGLLNTLGIIYAGEEMYPEARAAFNMAAASGYADAQANLGQLDRVEEQL